MKLTEFATRVETMFNTSSEARLRIISLAKEKGLTDEAMSYYSWMEKLDLLDEDSVCSDCGLPKHLGRCLKS